jgi:hypothetical protein
MGLTRKKPCTICRRWFVPDPRIGKRQRACKPECQAARRKKVQAGWRAKNPDYFIWRRIKGRGAQERAPGPLRLPPPLSRLPWDLAQSEFTAQGADFIGVMATLLLRAAQSEIKAHVVDCIGVSGTHANSEAQAEMQLGP